jgi:hypothetical protein
MRAGPRFEAPMGAKIGFTLWMLIWVPVILTEQGPQNFFWLCNIAQFLILYCLWSGNLLLLSSQAGTVVLVGIGWTLDVLLALALGGNSLTGFTDYMFSDELALSARLASLYHVAVPVFLLWHVRQVRPFPPNVSSSKSCLPGCWSAALLSPTSSSSGVSPP